MTDASLSRASSPEEPASQDTEGALAGSMDFWEFLASSAGVTAERDGPATADNPVGVLLYRYAPDGTLMQVDERGRAHRLDGPVFDDERSREWWVHGQLHRLDGPALESSDGAWEWRRRGRPHRTDGPAIRRADGTLEWWVNGGPHRTDGPAIRRGDGTLEWWVDGLSHREGGPSCIEADGTRRWHTHGRLERVEFADGRVYLGD